MFITDKRIEEINQLIDKEGIDVLQKLNAEEVQAFFDATPSDSPQSERDRAICEAYKSGVLTPEDDPYILW